MKAKTMTITRSPTNWPNPERPGEPMSPDRDGKHVIDVDPDGQKTELVYYWKAKHQVWVEYDYQGADDALEGYDLIGWVYVGPVLTPTQINEMLVAERFRISGQTQNMLTLAMSRFGLDTINSILEEMRPKNDRSDWTEYAHTKSDFVDEAKKRFREIRNLGAAP